MALTVIGLISFGSLIGYSQTDEAEIDGIISDSSGAALPNAQLTLTNVETGVTRSVTSGTNGAYRFAPVVPGTYNIEVDANGFQSETIEHLEINLGAHITQNIALIVGSGQQTVEVTAEVPIVDTVSQSVSGVIDQQQITNLPLNTRQYLNLALLEPGTTQAGSRTFYNNVQIGGGQYYYANGFMMDGVRNTWAEQGEPRQNFPAGAVQEFKVYSAEYPAEYGLYMGGLVTVATKSGTNNIHGEVFEYWRNQALNRDNVFQQQAEVAEHTGNPFNRNQFGADFGGPIVKDRLHYYLAYERTQTTGSFTIFTSLPQYYGSLQGTFKQPSYDQMINARIDGQLSNTQSVFFRYAQEWNGLTYQGCGGNGEINCYDGLIPRHSFVAGHTWNPGATIVNEFRFQFAYASYQLGPPGSVWPNANTLATSPQASDNLQLAYVFPSFAYGFGYQEDGVEKRWEGNDVLSIAKGSNTLQMGFDIDYVSFLDARASDVQGTYAFATDQPFNPSNAASIAALTNPILFFASIPPIATSIPSWELGFFFSDAWRAMPGLTVNLGLRYDREIGSFDESLNPNSFPQPIPFLGNPNTRGDADNVGPRVGIAWDPFRKGRDAFRAGYGIYYNNIQTLEIFPEKQDLALCNIIIFNPPYPDPYGSQTPSSFCSTAPPNVTVLAHNFANPYSQQFDVGYSHQFTNTLVLTVDGVYQHSLRDFRIVDLNYPAADGVRPLAQWGQILQYQPTAQANYRAMFLKVYKRFSTRFQSTLSYTLSSADDNAPQSGITNYASPNLDWGPASIDARHQFVASGYFNLPWRFELGAILTLRSSLPFSAFETTTNADGTAQYVPGTSRDEGERGLNLTAVNVYRATVGLAPMTRIDSNFYSSLDVRISRWFFAENNRRLEIIAQCFNVLGHKNLLAGDYIMSAASPSFGTITSAANLQQAELAARYVF